MRDFYEDTIERAMPQIDKLNKKQLKELCKVAIQELIITDVVRASSDSIYWETSGDGLIEELNGDTSDEF